MLHTLSDGAEAHATVMVYGKHTKQNIVLLLLLLRGCSVNHVYTHYYTSKCHNSHRVSSSQDKNTVTAIVELKYSHNYIEIKWL